MIIGYNYLILKPDTLELLNEMYEKWSEIRKYSLNYSIVSTISFKNTSEEVKGTASEISINGNSKIEFIPIQATFEYYESYLVPEGNIGCRKASITGPLYECEEVESEELTIPRVQLDLLKDWIKKGIIKVSLEGTRKIIGRECYNFRFDVDSEKLAREVDTTYSREEKPNITFFHCLDKEFGLPLLSEMISIVNLTLLGRHSFFQKWEATALSFDVKIDKIDLPLPFGKIKWLPKFSIVGTSCDANSNEVKVVIKAKKDISGKAIVKLKSTKFVRPEKNVTSYNHYCFLFSNITSNTSLYFGFKNIGDSYPFSTKFIIGIDCPEVKGKPVVPYYPKECRNCSKGKYCSMEVSSTSSYDIFYPFYTFDSDLPGPHEICIWTSNYDYVWEVIEIERKLTRELDVGKISKGEKKTLNFTLPFYIDEKESYMIELTIGNFTSSFSCLPFVWHV